MMLVKKIIIALLCFIMPCYATNNQTSALSPVLLNNRFLFQITIELADFALPAGIHSGATAQYGSHYLFIAGRTNGLHGFNNDTHNFPPDQQNTTVFVVNVHTKTVQSRSLYDASSGLNQNQIDTLSVTSPQSYQSGNTLYITGGYGVDTGSGTFSTKDTLTAIDVQGLIHWVTHPQSSTLASSFIRQISDPVFQVTGGAMYQHGDNPTLLIFGQNFTGFYTALSSGVYTQQVRRFYIIDDGKHLGVKVVDSTVPDSNYNRRDLNVIPIIKMHNNKKVPAYVALSGVFTPNGGVWTVPVEITAEGTPFMADPNLDTTFKQGMNNYACPHVELLAPNSSMYSVLFGGLTFEYYDTSGFATDGEIPFTNQVTIIQRTSDGLYRQYLSPFQYPTIASTASNPGNTLLFGAGGTFIIAPNMPLYANRVLKLEKIKRPTVIGYIVGGIQSTLPNTFTSSDSAASPYIFKVTLTPFDR
jgi:hypothetical protein